MDTENLDLILNANNEYNIHSFASNEEMSSDLQKRLKRINKLTDGLYETKFKIDRYKFDRALKSTLHLLLLLLIEIFSIYHHLQTHPSSCAPN